MKKFSLTSYLFFFFMIVTSNAQKWININPTFDPPGNYIISGTFKNANEGWMVAVGQLPQSLYHTVDGGFTWSIQIEKDSTFYSNFIFVDETYGWIKGSRRVPSGLPPSYEYYLWNTRDGGSTWQEVSTPPDSVFFVITFIDSLTGFSGGENAIYRTTDGGESWQPGTIEPGVRFGVTDIYFVDEQYGWAVGGSSDYWDMGIILKTIDGGETWQVNEHPSGITGYGVYFTDYLNGYVVGSNPPFFNGVIQVTNDGGENWETHYLPSSWLNDVIFTDYSAGWVVGDYGFIWYTEDAGESWKQVESGTDADLNQIVFVENGKVGYIFGNNNTLLRYDRTTDVKVDDFVIPSIFELYQNYPNPFNPETVIAYELKGTAFVILKLYDLIGKEVMTLVNEKQTEGSYQVVWNGRNKYGKEVSSGIYFYRMKTDAFSQTRKMILIR